MRAQVALENGVRLPQRQQRAHGALPRHGSPETQFLGCRAWGDAGEAGEQLMSQPPAAPVSRASAVAKSTFSLLARRRTRPASASPSDDA